MSLQNVLSRLLEEGFITYMDFEIYKRIKEDFSHDVLAVLSLVVNFNLKKGDSCVDLSDLADKDLGVVLGYDKPLGYKLPNIRQLIDEVKQASMVSENGLFYLYKDKKLFFKRVYNYELTVANILKSLAENRKPVDIGAVKCERCDFWQKLAVAMSESRNLLIISGGPGTGKTTTIRNIVEHLGRDKSIGLCAPTGKAVSRMIESLSDIDINPPMTLHRFLKADEQLIAFSYNDENKLPYDVVIVDEASMVNIELAYRLLIALKTGAKLILVGDKDQLSSVEAGIFLGEICSFKNMIKSKTLNVFSKDFINFLQEKDKKQIEVSNKPDSPIVDCAVELIRNFRFNEKSKIGALASAIKKDDVGLAIKIIEDDEQSDLIFKDRFDGSIINSISKEYACAIESDIDSSFEKIKVLTPLRISPLGSIRINELIDKNLSRHFLSQNIWYSGRQVIVNSNDYQNGLFNGDIGVCFEKEGKKFIKFNKTDGNISIAPELLPEHDLAFAMSVHKSQGSEFDSVYFVIGFRHAKILTRELIYTAITRARKKVCIIGDKKIFIEGLKNKSKRKSALGELLFSQ